MQYSDLSAGVNIMPEPRTNKPSGVPLYYVSSSFDVAYRKSVSEYPVGPHSHNAVEFYFTLTDLPDALLNDTVQAVTAGALLIIPAFCVHQLFHEVNVEYERYILTIHDKWLKSVLWENSAEYAYLSDSEHPLVVFPTAEKREELIRDFDKLLSHADRSSLETLIHLLRLLYDIDSMRLTLKNTGQSVHLPVSASQKKVNEIISYLNEHLTENLSLSDLASHFYLHPDYLARLFKKHMHIPVGQYITLQKISTAEALLREGMTVTEVQESLGFSSYAYFFRTFQKITGISPGKYRRLVC